MVVHLHVTAKFGELGLRYFGHVLRQPQDNIEPDAESRGGRPMLSKKESSMDGKPPEMNRTYVCRLSERGTRQKTLGN